MKSRANPLALEWLKRAEADFGFAKASFEEFDDFYSQMCILCHDAAEKYLKAYLVSRGEKYQKIHDLVTLLKDCSKASDLLKSFLNLEEGCKILNHYYVPLKYPSHFPFATKKQAKEAIDIAEEIGCFVKSKIR